MKRGMRAQSSVEYIFIVAFALLIIIPGAFVFSQYTGGSQTALRNAQIYKVGSDIVDASEVMYSVGQNSWQTLELTFPSTITNLEIYNGSDGITELVITYEDRYTSQAVFFTEVPITNSSSTPSSVVDCSNGCPIPFSDGKNKIRVESLSNSIVILRVIK